MYSREKVELFLLATEDGMGPTAAAEFAGVTVSAAKKWATGHLPRSYTGGGCRIVARKPPRKEASLGPDKSTYAPPATGPLAGLNEDQIENLLLRAVLADLKAAGWDPASISNRSKCELGERLRRATALPLRSITGFLRISKSSYEYWRPRVAAPRDRDADIRDRVVRIFREGSGRWGYRTVWARLRREGVRASGKRVARVMREEGLEVVYNKRRARGYSSYAGEVSKAPENLVNRNFRADEPNRLWLADITEFRLPGGEKVYLSPVIDCFDGMPVAWSIGLHPDKRLANSSLLKARAARPAGARTTIHSDRGGHYRWPEWIAICEENGLVRSMSAKGCSPDNSACEGFFGRLKNEFFRYRDWEGVTAEEFMGRLERVARVMREEGLEVVYNKRRARGYSSYAGEVSKAPENLVNRNFRADEPNRLWLADITEFRLPGGEKVYLSPVIDCFDGMPVAWSIGLHPDKRLANSSLLKARAARPAGARTTIHSDRGGHYRWPEWIAICEENGLVRSMSAKGCSPDNSACEGFFGRLKNEFFRYRDWEGVTAEEFMGRLEAYLVYYREERIKKSLGWLSPMEYRRKLGYA